METAIVRKTWGEREGVTLDLLRKFTKAGDPRFGEVQQVWAYGGDFTESGDRRRKLEMGEEAYEHSNWDAVACNGGVVVVVPRWKFGDEKRGEGLGLRSEYWWAMSAIEVEMAGSGIRPCTEEEIARVVPETRQLLAELPGLEFMQISKVSFYSTGKPGKKQWKDAPQDVRYFRFAAGYGCLAIAEGAGNVQGHAAGRKTPI